MSRPGDTRERRRTKLICTIGPTSGGRIETLAAAGMDVARINFSHGTPASHAAAALAVRRAAAAGQRPLAILTDLAGPKVRLGDLAGGSVDLEAGRPFVLRVSGSSVSAGDASERTVSYRRMAGDVRIGDPVFLADGAVELRVTAVDDGVRTEVVRGGSIRSRAGVAIPAARLSSPALTAKDRSDIPRAVAIGANYVGLSFVRSAEDVVELRRAARDGGPAIVAKIETRPAVDSFDAILDVADAVMIARGDLGVEMPYEEVPLIQKQLVRRALDHGVPSIVATQMLESMTPLRGRRGPKPAMSPTPCSTARTRSCLGETAIGAYPVQAAEAAARIASLCETQGVPICPTECHDLRGRTPRRSHMPRSR